MSNNLQGMIELCRRAITEPNDAEALLRVQTSQDDLDFIAGHPI